MSKPNLNNEMIYIYIYDFGSENKASHAALQFAGEIIDFSPRGFSETRDETRHECRIYSIDPKKINIDPEKLVESIQKRKEKIAGDDYFYFGENCAKQVCAVLRDAGAKDLPDETGLDIPTPTMSGMSKVIKDEINVPVVGEIAGGVVRGISEAAKFITGQETLEEYCQKNGKLAETRVPSSEYYKTKNKFRTLMAILHDPKAYQQELKKDCEAELAGKSPDEESNLVMSLFKKYKDTLSPKEATQMENKYKKMFTRKPPTEQEKLAIRIRYAQDLSLAMQPPEKLKEEALALFLNSKNDDLLRSELIRIADEEAPEIALEYKLKYERLKENLHLGKKAIQDSNVEATSPVPSARNSNQGRYS